MWKVLFVDFLLIESVFLLFFQKSHRPWHIDLDIYLKIEDNIIKDISFEGEACVISISSTNILANMLVGKSKEEGIYLIDNYLKMINEEEYDKDVLKELLVFDDTSRQPSRIKCATLSANGIKDYLEEENHSQLNG